MSSLIKEAQDKIVARQKVPSGSWWTYRGASGHARPEALIHVITASDEEFLKIAYVTTGNLRVEYPKFYTGDREKYEIDQMAQLERGFEEMSLYQFKLWISQGTFQQFNGNHA